MILDKDPKPPCTCSLCTTEEPRGEEIEHARDPLPTILAIAVIAILAIARITGLF